MNGDTVYITSVIDVHNVFVRKIVDENDDFFKFIRDVNLYYIAGIY